MHHHLLLILHLISAAIWVGGHLCLAVGILPGALKKKDYTLITQFEKRYEPIGMSSLVVLVVTGMWMALQFGIGPGRWFSFSNPLERVVSVKIILLLATVLFAISAQTRVIPHLATRPKKLYEMAFHIIGVTTIGVAMLILGSFVRYGGI
ncbi:CopD family protein [Filimonas effusa]|nr:CopD family protein [Filimonas effusa]